MYGVYDALDNSVSTHMYGVSTALNNSVSAQLSSYVGGPSMISSWSSNPIFECIESRFQLDVAIQVLYSQRVPECPLKSEESETISLAFKYVGVGLSTVRPIRSG
jgi:hypothetical protein